jgi:hypothetical protein
MSTNATCSQCCVQLHSAGQTTAVNALTSCACGTSGVCKTQCATEFCAKANTTAGDACDTCIQNSLSPDAGAAGCYNQFATACTNDPDCVALYGNTGCLSGCPAQ